MLEMVKAFEQTSGKSIPYQISARRAGDVDTCYARVDKAATDLGWKATQTLQDMCASTWDFQKNR